MIDERKMKKILLIFLTLYGIAEAQILSWKHEIAHPTAESTSLTDLDFDSKGNVYVAGYYVVGYQDPLDPAPMADGAFIQKYSTNGQLLWSDTVKGGFRTRYNALAIDNADNINAFGTFVSSGPVTINNSPVYYNSFRVKYSPNGQVASVTNADGRGDVLYSAAENAFYQLSGNSSMGLAKFDNNWNIVWTQSLGQCGPRRLRVDGNKITILGAATSLTSGQLVRMSTNGQVLWTNNTVSGNDLIVDDALNSFLSVGTEIMKYDTSGKFLSSFLIDTTGVTTALQYYNGHLITNNGGIQGNQLINNQYLKDSGVAIWNTHVALSSCCARPERLAVNNNNLYAIGTFGEYGAGFVYKIELPEVTGINMRASANTISLYPNPAKNNLVLSAASPLGYRLTNTLGSTLIETQNAQFSHTIDVSHLSPGIYFLIAGERYSKRVVISE
jgi:hypothetical protein